jgi:hypothetical protein
MSGVNAIESLHWIEREKEAQRSEHKQKQEDEAIFLKKTKIEKELRRAKRRVLNI